LTGPSTRLLERVPHRAMARRGSRQRDIWQMVTPFPSCSPSSPVALDPAWRSDRYRVGVTGWVGRRRTAVSGTVARRVRERRSGRHAGDPAPLLFHDPQSLIDFMAADESEARRAVDEFVGPLRHRTGRSTLGRGGPPRRLSRTGLHTWSWPPGVKKTPGRSGVLSRVERLL
jgi:hypothetical protein